MSWCSDIPFHILADPPGKPALLLLHGFLSSRHHWQPNLPALRTRYRIVLAELPGHGNAPPCTDPARLSPDALADGLEDWRARSGIDRWHVIGQSFGAALTLRYALRHPGAVGAQVWTNANRALAPPWTDAQRAAHGERVRRLKVEGQRELRRQRFHPRFAKRFPPDLRATLTRDADGVDVDTMVAMLDHTSPRLSLRADIHRMRVPTLLINGRFERGFQLHRDAARALLPDMEVVDLDGGHSVNIETAAAFDSAALAFLARHPLGNGAPVARAAR